MPVHRQYLWLACLTLGLFLVFYLLEWNYCGNTTDAEKVPGWFVLGALLLAAIGFLAAAWWTFRIDDSDDGTESEV